MNIFKCSLVLSVFCFAVVFCQTTTVRNTLATNSSEEDSDEDVDVESRILYGLIAKPKTFPFIVSLQEKDADGTDKFCGGVIIKEKWILTAAHCYEDVGNGENFKNDYRVKAGVVKAFSRAEMSQFVRVKKIILHPQYDPEKTANDIALLLLTKPLKYNKHVRPIALPMKNYIAKGKGTIIGWGAIDQAEEISSKELRYAEIPVSKRKHCRKLFKEITTKQLCLGYNVKENACAGDSGGPFVQNINGKPAVVGVTSFGTHGCNENDPIVYTNVASYLQFIKDTISANTDRKVKVKSQSGTNFMEYPFLVSIMDFNAEDDTYEKICTGVIVHDQSILTTADCFDNTDKTYYPHIRVQVGTISIDKPKQGQLYKIISIQKHPSYDISDTDMKNNLAIVKLQTPLKLSPNVVKAFLPPSYYDLEDMKGKIIGWNVDNSSLSHTLTVTNVKNGNLAACTKLYPNATSAEICVERVSGECIHDSGSPLVVKSQNGYFVIGLQSIFNTHCTTNQPFLVTNILHYSQFIDNSLNNII